MSTTNGSKHKTRHKTADQPLPAIRSRYLGEPPLVFADGRQDVDPKLGLSRFGPKSWRPERRHPSSLRVGFLGSAETIEQAHRWIEKSAEGVHGDADHPEFPGCMADRGFMTKLVFDSAWSAPLYRSELDETARIKGPRERFVGFASLIETKLRLLAERDHAPEYVVIALPNELYRKYRVADYKDKAMGTMHRDLRRVIKAMAMKYRIPTQILRDQTSGETTGDNPSKVAWNFFTGLYCKAGGSPWGPVGLQPGTCYIGISFYRPLGSAAKRVQTSLVQAFDEHGDGLVLRGHEFDWDADKEGTNSPHLTEEQAERLVELVLGKYQSEMGQRPQRVVVHKTSRYWGAEKRGFEQALSRQVQQYDLLALSPQSSVRLIPKSQYPALRSTAFSVDDLDFLYTTGFISELNQFHGTHVPAPILIADHVGSDTPRETLLREILILTKMNWNSARLGGLLPITLRFSRLVGDIMREIGDWDPLTNFKYYT